MQRLFLIAAVLLLSRTLSPATEGGYEGAKWAFLDAKQVLSAAAEVTPAKYPDCDQAIVDEKIENDYRADGTGETQIETFQKVLTEKGKRDGRTLSLYFQLPYNTVDVVKMEVIKPDGQVAPVDVAANSKEMIDDSQMAMNIYDPNSKILKVNIPGVEIGDVVHSISRTTTERPIIPGEFADETEFEGDAFIRHMSYEVEAPEDKPLKHIMLRDEVPGTVVASTHPGDAHTLVYHWEINQVPRMFAEPSMPSYGVVLQRLLVTTTPDWQTISKWYWNLSQAHLVAQTPDMKETVEQLTAQAQTEPDKIKAIFHYVSNKIRYMGLTPEKDRPGYEPHDVKVTFSNKYGVCRDKAALLVSMLRLASINAYPVLTNYGAKRDQDVPNPFFNHAIVGVEQGKGSYLLMDPTDENTRVLFPSAESDQSFLVARPEGETLLTSSVVASDENMVHIKTEASLNAEGQLTAKSVINFDGYNDNAYREGFSEMKTDDRRRFFERILKESLPGAKLDSLTITPEKMSDVSSDVRAELEFSVDDTVASGGGKAIVNLPWIGKKLGVVNFILNGTGLEKRKYPLRTSVACGVQEDIAMKLDPQFTGTVSMPSYTPIQTPFMTYDRHVEFKDGSLTGTHTLKLNVVEFSSSDYLKLKQILEKLAYDNRKAPVLEKADALAAKASQAVGAGADPQVDSNATILERQQELEVTDPHTAIYRVKYKKKILTYAGKKDESEIKVNYNPACEEARIVRAVVTSPTGQQQDISKDEINILDAGWNASAKRYTGGKILVANLPGVDVGSTIEVEYEITTKGGALLSHFEPFQDFDDVEKESFQLTLPPKLAFQKQVTGLSGTVAEESSVEKGLQTFRWSAKNIKALPEEPQLPPPWFFRAGVDYFIGDPKSYLTELQKTMLDRASQNAKTAVVAKQITGQATTRLDAAIAIRDFVAKSIRVAGPSFTDLPLSELSAADTTLSDGYGHAADRAILLYAMLSASGFQPEFILASALPPIPGVTEVAKSSPVLDAFKFPLVRISLDGETYYLDDTDQYAKMGTTSFDGRWAIALGDQTYAVIKAPAGCENKTDSEIKLSLADNGNAEISFSRQIYGEDYNFDKKYFAELTPEERKRYFQQLVAGIAQGARPVGDLTTDFTGYPGILRYTVAIDDYSVVDGNYMYFDLPYTPSLFPAGADRRLLPLYLTEKTEHTTRIEMELPPNFQKVAIAPQNQTLAVPGTAGTAKVNVVVTGNKYIITDQLETSPAIIGPQDYPAMLKVESTLSNKSSKAFLLGKS
jgi:transglutaminase-like putative cysteine protease